MFVLGIDKTSGDVSYSYNCLTLDKCNIAADCLCYNSHSTPLLLPHYLHVDVNGGSSVVYCIGESVYTS